MLIVSGLFNQTIWDLLEIKRPNSRCNTNHGSRVYVEFCGQNQEIHDELDFSIRIGVNAFEGE